MNGRNGKNGHALPGDGDQEDLSELFADHPADQLALRRGQLLEAVENAGWPTYGPCPTTGNQEIVGEVQWRAWVKSETSIGALETVLVMMPGAVDELAAERARENSHGREPGENATPPGGAP